MKHSEEQMSPQHRKSDSPFIRSKKGAIWAAVLTVLSLLFVMNYPGPMSWLEEIFVWLGIPLSSRDNGSGLLYPGLVLTGLMLMILYLIVDSFGYHRLLIVVLTFALLQYIPGLLNSTYQSLFASGVYALQIDLDSTKCNYAVKEGRFTASCLLSAENFSREPVSITGSIAVNRHARYDNDQIQLPDVQISRQRLLGRESRVIQVEVEQPMDSVDKLLDMSGSSKGIGMIVTLSDGRHERTWRD